MRTVLSFSASACSSVKTGTHCSAKAQMADVQRGFELGADDYVTKPFDPIELIDKVTALVAAARRR